jgi:hypothetical protein
MLPRDKLVWASFPSLGGEPTWVTAPKLPTIIELPQ